MLKSGDEPVFGVDLTLLLACAVLLAVAIRIPKATWVRATFEIVTLFALFLPAVFWTRWFDYSRDKVLYLFTLTLLAATAPTIILRGAQQLRRFFIATVVVALIVTVSGIRGYLGDPTQLRAAALGASTIALGQIVGSVTLILAVWQQGKSASVRVLCLALVGVCGILLLATGSRSSIISLAIASLALVGLSKVERGRTAVAVAGLVGGFLVALLVINQFIPESSFARVLDLLHGIDYGGAQIRSEYAKKTIAHIADVPFGQGWGGFAIVLEGTTERAFPHNLLLEITYEAGWLAGIGFFATSLVAIERAVVHYRRRLEPEYLCLAVLLVFHFVSSFVTGETNDSRWLFALIGAGLTARALPLDARHDSAEGSQTA
jgi:hypothetical protein